MQNLVTLIIILHNRHANLDRLLTYYQDITFPIIIADSSKERHDFITKPSNIYLYTPGITYTQKVELALAKVNTPYVVMCADDDFVIPSAIFECVNFLEKNKDYAVAQGRCICFLKDSISSTHVDFRALYEDVNYNLEADDANLRIEKIFNPYRSILYAVHRTESLKLVFANAGTFIKNLFLNEYLTAVIPAAFGKYKELPILFSVREYAEDSDDKTTTTLDSIVFEADCQVEYDSFLNHQSFIIANILNMELAVCKKKLNELFTNFALKLKKHKSQIAAPPKKKIGYMISLIPFFGKKIIYSFRSKLYKKSIEYAVKTEDDIVGLSNVKKNIIRFSGNNIKG